MPAANPLAAVADSAGARDPHPPAGVETAPGGPPFAYEQAALRREPWRFGRSLACSHEVRLRGLDNGCRFCRNRKPHPQPLSVRGEGGRRAGQSEGDERCGGRNGYRPAGRWRDHRAGVHRTPRQRWSQPWVTSGTALGSSVVYGGERRYGQERSKTVKSGHEFSQNEGVTRGRGGWHIDSSRLTCPGIYRGSY